MRREYFVDGRRKHADRSEEQLVILVRGLPELDNEFLDVPGHVVEDFRQFADFRRALHGSALVKFTAADGERGCGKRPNRRADAHGE